MTLEEFNKLPKQERIDLTFNRCAILWSTYNNPTRNITHKYARLSEQDEWQLVCTISSQNDWFGEVSNRFFGTDYHSITIAIENGIKCFAKRLKDSNTTVIISNDDIKDEFLESIMFDEIPEGETKSEYLDEFDSHFYLFPQAVIEMAREVNMDTNEYIKKSREKGDWLKPKPQTTLRKTKSWFRDSETLTKVNIALIGIAVLITLINILVFL